MKDFCEDQKECRHVLLLKYFGEDLASGPCGNRCDNCLRQAGFKEDPEWPVSVSHVHRHFLKHITVFFIDMSWWISIIPILTPHKVAMTSLLLKRVTYCLVFADISEAFKVHDSGLFNKDSKKADGDLIYNLIYKSHVWLPTLLGPDSANIRSSKQKRSHWVQGTLRVGSQLSHKICFLLFEHLSVLWSHSFVQENASGKAKKATKGGKADSKDTNQTGKRKRAAAFKAKDDTGNKENCNSMAQAACAFTKASELMPKAKGRPELARSWILTAKSNLDKFEDWAVLSISYFRIVMRLLTRRRLLRWSAQI